MWCFHKIIAIQKNLLQSVYTLVQRLLELTSLHERFPKLMARSNENERCTPRTPEEERKLREF